MQYVYDPFFRKACKIIGDKVIIGCGNTDIASVRIHHRAAEPAPLLNDGIMNVFVGDRLYTLVYGFLEEQELFDAYEAERRFFEALASDAGKESPREALSADAEEEENA